MLYENGKTVIRLMQFIDIPKISIAEHDLSDGFKNYFHNQLSWQEDGESYALLAIFDDQIAGYVFVHKRCRWGAMRNLGLPSIVDLFVLEKYRENGVGSALLDVAESLAAQISDKVYLDVPVNSAHGKAQRLYVKRGYIPDGNGIYNDSEGNGYCNICPIDTKFLNDDRTTLCMVKQLRNESSTTLSNDNEELAK